MSQPEQLPTPNSLDPLSPVSPCETVLPSAPGGVHRRTVIRSAGVIGAGVIGVATLAACGGGGDSATPASSPANGASGANGAAGPAGGAIKVADIPVGGGKVFSAQKVVVTQPTAGEFKAFDATCTHMGCVVAGVANGTIDCACHGSKFDLATGAVTNGPATTPLPTKQATVSGDSITIS